MRTNTDLPTFIALASVLIALAGGCGGGGNRGLELTDSQMDAIEADSQTITQIVAHSGGGSIEQAQQQAAELPTVAWARAEAGTLTVRYKGAGCEYWVDPPAWKQPDVWPTAVPQPPSEGTVRPAELVGGANALLINSLADDPGLSSTLSSLFDEAELLLTQMGYQVDRLEGESCTFQAMTDLSGAGVVGLCSHGGEIASFIINRFTKRLAVHTGQTWTPQFARAHFTDWYLGRVAPMRIPWGLGDGAERRAHPRRMVALTDAFFQKYAAGSGRLLNHALFYNGAGQGLMNDTLANALASSGVAAYVGWTDTQRLGPYTMVQLFRSMRSGMSLQEAISRLGPGLKTDEYYDDQRLRTVQSELQFLPGAATSLRLATSGQGVNPFRVTLVWATQSDLDLHVFAAPSSHAYYANKAIDIGELDANDIDGYGPEHFTARQSTPGVYFVAVNYHSDPTQTGAASTRVRVETPNAVQSYGPHELSSPNANSGYPVTSSTESWWRVCDIEVLADGAAQIRGPDTSVPLGDTGYGASARHASVGPRMSSRAPYLGADPSMRPFLSGARRR